MFKKGAPIRKALGAISLLWVGSILGAALAFFTQVLLARELSPEGYGTFSSALATVTLFSPLAGFGVQGFWLKIFGVEGWNAKRWLTASFRFVTVSTTLTLSVYFLWVFLGPHDTSSQYLLLIMAPVILGYLSLELVTSKLLLEERFQALALWQMFPHFCRFMIVLVLPIVFLKPEGAESIACVYSIVAIAVFAVGAKQLLSMLGENFALKGHGVRAEHISFGNINFTEIARQSWPFGMATVFHLIYFQSDIIFLKYISGDKVAGIYNVAFTVLAAVYILPSVIYQKFLLPKIHRWSNHDRVKFYEVYRKGNIVMLVLGAIAMVCIWCSGWWAIPMLFGHEYEEAVFILNILAICAPVMFVASSVGASLVTQDHMARKVKYMGAVALINVLLNVLLVPKFGAVGAAASTVICNSILLAVYYIAAQKLVFGADRIVNQ